MTKPLFIFKNQYLELGGNNNGPNRKTNTSGSRRATNI